MNIKKAGQSISKLFWVNDNDDVAPMQEKETKAETAKGSIGEPKMSEFFPDKPDVYRGEPGKEDAQIKATLLDALNKANRPGYDYFEFSMAVEEQAKFIPAEETRYQASYAVAKTMGISQASLIDDANHYLNVLKEEETKFNTSIDGLTKQNVTSKEAELTSIDQRTAEKAEQIKKLTEEINQIQKEKNQIMNDVTQNKIKIEQLKNNFFATLKVITNRISGDIEKIKKYIPV